MRNAPESTTPRRPAGKKSGNYHKDINRVAISSISAERFAPENHRRHGSAEADSQNAKGLKERFSSQGALWGPGADNLETTLGIW
jgi:hypothetical protein